MYLCTAYSPTISRSGAKMISLVVRLVRVDLRVYQFMTGCGGRVLVFIVVLYSYSFSWLYTAALPLLPHD
jgi:hypothetical protein